MIVLAAAMIWLPGCGPESGAIWYWMGAGRGAKIEPKFTFPDGKVLVLVDDPHECVSHTQADDRLAQHLGEELLRHEAVTTIIDPDSLRFLRRTDPEFERRTAEYIGRKAEADVVLWAQVREYFAPQEVQDTSAAAKFSVSLKILNTRQDRGGRPLRLWPSDAAGHVESVELSANDISKLQSKLEVSEALAKKLAPQIARLFYEHTAGELEDDRFP
jgi:hypothetical protein